MKTSSVCFCINCKGYTVLSSKEWQHDYEYWLSRKVYFKALHRNRLGGLGKITNKVARPDRDSIIPGLFNDVSNGTMNMKREVERV
jgi:hypothetical protein